ncbi:MAG TPA: hypothetical protein VF032_15780 [Thermoleophilaceae bacterium]
MRRAPLVALGVTALFAGLWGGLLRLGLSVPGQTSDLAELHGPLMTLGFLGTLISLERAVALGRGWGFAAPLASGTGSLAAAAGAPGGFGPALLAFAAAVLLLEHFVIDRLQRTAHNAVMALGALAWLAAAVLWLAGEDTARFVPLLAGFLVLTIVGERLELSRLRGLGGARRTALLAAIALLAGGLALSIPAEGAGMRLAGAGLLAQAVWLARYDIARRTVHGSGVTRYMAVALLAGYAWLAAAGVLWLIHGLSPDGYAYDAQLHALFLGFVMSMVFAHAPVIVPAVLRVRLPFRPRFYVHLALLHASLALRVIGGDWAGDLRLWQWGGVAGELAILLFLAVTAAAVAEARRGREAAEGQAVRRSRTRGKSTLFSS